MLESKMNKEPLVSVVMPVYNAEKYVSEAVQSILNQTYNNFEFIIINDCSTDSTPKILEEFQSKDDRIKLIHNNKNLRICKSLNKGIKIAQGKYVARMDADDFSYPGRLALQVNFMESHPDVVVLGGEMDIINGSGKITGERRYAQTDKELKKTIFRYSPFSHPTIMVRKKALDRTNLYNPDFVHAEDLDLYFQLGRYGEFANLSDKVLKYRILESGTTTSRLRDMETKTLKIRKKYYEEYDATLIDRCYNFLQRASMNLMSPKMRVSLFTFLRNHIWKK